jgi:DNA polymerase phi
VSFADVSVLQSCVDSAHRLFSTSPRKPDVLDSFGDRDVVQQVHLEPIDVLVDIIISYLEKGTAFMRAVGNQSFSLLSSLVKESTVSLILTVSVSRTEFSILLILFTATGTSGPF